MQPVGSKLSPSGKISSELASRSENTSRFHGYHVSEKNDRRNKICDTNPLFPEANSPLHFSIDRATYEELKSSGLEARIVKQHTIRSYMNIENKSVASVPGSRGFSRQSDFSVWIKKELPKGVDKFFRENPYYVIALNVNDASAFENHIRHAKKGDFKLDSANQGESLGYLTFNENPVDKEWLDVDCFYVLPKYQRLGLGTLLVRALAGVGLSNAKKGVEFDRPTYYRNSSFYTHKGMEIIPRSLGHSSNCAQLKLLNDDGSWNTLHPLLPKPAEYPLEFKKMKAADPMALL